MSEPVYFLRLEVTNYRCFKRKVVLDLSDGKGKWKNWTVILGDNGTGKSSLLELLANFEMEQFLFNGEEIFFTKRLISSPSKTHSIQNIGRAVRSASGARSEGTINLNIHWGKGAYENYIDFFIADNYPIPINETQDKRLIQLICFGYGANRKMGIGSLNKILSDNSETLYDDAARLVNAEEWLLQLDYAASKDSTVKEFAANRRNQVKQVLIDLLPDISDIRFSIPTKEELQLAVEFETPFGWVTIHKLSLGYKTMVSWMVDLAARLFERYPDSDNPLAEPAIVLVDEIDLHMHPKWQRKIFDYLSEKFPQTQFIVTAHSPLVVQSAPKDANIVLLRREGDHVLIDNDIQSVQNWRIDQILTSDLFGLESARGPATAQWLKERKELLQKQKRTTEEEKRLSELNIKAYNLPTADNKADIEAMDIIRQAAEIIKNQKA